MERAPQPGHVLFFFNDTATTEIYTLSLHDALPIYHLELDGVLHGMAVVLHAHGRTAAALQAIEEVERHRRGAGRSEEHTSELQSPDHLVCRLLLEKKNTRLTPRQTPQTHSACQPPR